MLIHRVPSSTFWCLTFMVLLGCECLLVEGRRSRNVGHHSEVETARTKVSSVKSKYVSGRQSRGSRKRAVVDEDDDDDEDDDFVDLDGDGIDDAFDDDIDLDDDDDDDEDDDEETIELVNEDRIQGMIDENDRNILIVFYDKRSKCPTCEEAMKEMEEIDDDLEATGWIEVVKTNDRDLAKDLGVTTFPAVVYYRRQSPILYDGDFDDSRDVLRWVRRHDQVASMELDDDDFEDHTDSSSPPQGAMDWFVLFYSEKNPECNSYLPAWENVAHRLRGLVHCGHLDISESDDVADRFHIDEEDECPSFLLFRKGKMHRYKDQARDITSLVNFALFRFKEQRGHRVPDPPTKIEELFEEVKEDIIELFEDRFYIVVIVVFILLIFFMLVWIGVKIVLKRQASASSGDKDKSL